jgi:hypothetical protein
MPSRPIRSALLVSGAIAALTLSACREDAPPSSAAVGYGLPPAALAYNPTLAPPLDALPPAPPAPIGQPVAYDAGYAWAERAYAMDRAFYEAPPDYGFYYGEVEPWAWETQEDWTLYAEPIADGYRYYYYEPGADHPYFVRDDDYGYGFDDAGRLVTLYTVAGALLPHTYLDDRAETAGRYWRRARELRRAAAHAERQRVAEEMWLSRQPVFERSRASWFQAAQQQDDWRRYRVRHEARDQRRFEPERERRRATIARLERAELRQAEAVRRDDRDRQRAAALARHEDRRAWREARQDRAQAERRVRDDARRAEHAQAEARDRAEARAERNERRGRLAQAQAERGRHQAQAERVERQARHQQAARAQAERRSHEEARGRERQERRAQMAHAEAERGRRQAEAHQRREAAHQARAAAHERRGQAVAEARGARARDAGQAGRDASARERQHGGGGDHGGHGGGRGPKRDR